MFEITSRDGITEILIRGELDIAAGPPLRYVVDGALKAGARRIVLNLIELAFIDIRGAEAIVSCTELAGHAGASLRVSQPSASTQTVLEFVGAADLMADADNAGQDRSAPEARRAWE